MPTKAQYRLPPSARLKSKRDFNRVQQRSGESLKSYGRGFLVLALNTDFARSRIGITVTLKIDKRAVVRNLIKRYVREVFRVLAPEFTRSADIVVIARQDSVGFDLVAVEKELRSSFARLGLLRP